MWVSRKRFQALEQRIRELERSNECAGFTLYEEKMLKAYHDAGIWEYSNIPHQDLSQRQAIERILSHIGVELKYVEGTPATVALKKVKAK